MSRLARRTFLSSLAASVAAPAILRAAAMLHDIGSFIAFPKHHKHSYYLIKSSRPSSFNKEDVDLIANVPVRTAGDFASYPAEPIVITGVTIRDAK